MPKLLSVALFAAALICPAALAQEAYTIEAEGAATIDVAPVTIQFRLELIPQGSNNIELVKKTEEFEAAIRSQVQQRSLTPTQMTFSGLNYSHPANFGPNTSASLRFAASTYTVGEDAPKKLAALYDEINAIVAATGFPSLAVTYDVDEPAQIEAAAIARAVEKAYPNAKAAADVMNARILTVGNVRIGNVVWSSPVSPPADYNIRRVTCTARVTVDYAYAPTS